MNLATTREHSVKYVSRRGKELIKHAFIATGNEVWEIHGAKSLTFQIFFDGCVAVAANELQK